MSDFFQRFVLLAQDGAANPPAGDGGGGGLFGPWWLLIAMVVLFYLLILRPQGREQARRREMLSAIKKNDRVVTNSGIFGIVTSVDPEAGEVTLRVDESNNTKLRMTLSSIAQVLGGESSGSPESK